MINLNSAKWHLRIDGTEQDAEIQSLLNLAAMIVYQYIGSPRGIPNPFATTDQMSDELSQSEALRTIGYGWEADGTLDAAVLLVLGELWCNREAGTANPLSPGVRLLLDRIKVLSYA